jgi:transcriptional regulator with XRE-family HTH domain
VARSLGSSLLLRWRESLDLLQADAAQVFGISQGMLSLLETGQRLPGRALGVKIAAATEGKVPVSSWDVEAPDGAGDSSEVVP